MEEAFHLLNLTHQESLLYLKRKKERTLTRIEFIARLQTVSFNFTIIVKVGMSNNVDNP